MRKILLSATSIAALGLIACQPAAEAPEPAMKDAAAAATEKPANTVETLTAAANAGTENGPPTLQEAKEFLEQAEKEIVELRNYSSKIFWVQANFITQDTNALAARAGAQGARL